MNIFPIQIIKLILSKQEHADTIEILWQQSVQYEGQIDNRMSELEITWREKEYESTRGKIEYLRYKQEKLDRMGACFSFTTETWASKTNESGISLSRWSWSMTWRFI